MADPAAPPPAAAPENPDDLATSILRPKKRYTTSLLSLSLSLAGLTPITLPPHHPSLLAARSPNRLIVQESTGDDNSVCTLNPATMDLLGFFRGDTVLVKCVLAPSPLLLLLPLPQPMPLLARQSGDVSSVKRARMAEGSD